MAQKSTICSLTEMHQSFSISLEYRLMPFCIFVDKSKYRNNRKCENKQSENAEDKISAEFRKFSLYFIIEILGMGNVFHNKLSFMGAGFLILFVLRFANKLALRAAKNIAYHCYTTKNQFAFIDAIV